MTCFKRYLALLLIVSFVIPALALLQPTAQAAGSYDPYKAIAYAEANWDSGQGLCAEFVWHCLKAGGLNISSSGLHDSPYVTTGVAEAACKAIGKTYTGVKDFPRVSTDRRFGPTHASRNHPNNKNLSIGDLLFIYCETCGKTPHVVICSGYRDDSVCVYGHNVAQQHDTTLLMGTGSEEHYGHQFSLRYLDLSDVAERDCGCGALFDLSEDAWYHEYVHEVLNMGLMSGVSKCRFSPEGSMTRAMVVTVLYRYNYEPETAGSSFSDVGTGQWYTNAVSWAAESGIVGGVGSNRFDPNGNVTREQLAAILYRYTAFMDNDCSASADLSSFPDAGNVSPWAVEAMRWAVAEGLINGSEGKLLPQGNATRTQVAAILIRYINKYGVIPTSGCCGDNVTWSLDAEGTMTFSGEGAMWESYENYYSVGAWKDQSTFVKRIVVEDGVTNFFGRPVYKTSYPSLVELYLADSVTKLSASSFADCRKLTKVRLSSNLMQLPESVFENCIALTSIELPESLGEIDSFAFSNCVNLSSIVLPDGLLSIGAGAFAGCTSFTQITLPKTLTQLHAGAFSNCSGITSLKIPASVENILTGSERANTLVYLFPCPIVVDSDNPFYCSDHYGVLFTKDKTGLLCAHEDLAGDYQIPSTVTSIDAYAFSTCSSLTSVTMGDQVDSIGNYAFSYCAKLLSVQLPSHAKELGSGVFFSSPSLKKVDIPEGLTILGDMMFYSCTSLEQVTLPQSLTTIRTFAFDECCNLNDLVIPENVSSIGYQSFTNCHRIRNLYFKGDAPYYFDVVGGKFTIRYIAGKAGWTSPTWNGYPTATWTP